MVTGESANLLEPFVMKKERRNGYPQKSKCTIIDELTYIKSHVKKCDGGFDS